MKETLISKLKETIINSDKNDVYAISLYLEYQSDNVYEPNIILSYNTNENVNSVVNTGVDELEARWNYAYWLQEDLYVFGDNDTKEIIKNWLLKNNFGYMDYDEYFNSEVEDELINNIDSAIKNEIVEVIKELHSSGFIKEQFSMDIPVIVHELEYYDEILEINKKANPEHTINDFKRFFIEA